MKLTDKCKEDFEKWYAIEFEKRNLPYINGFDISDLSIKFGVYVDFFIESKMYVYIKPFANLYSIYIDWQGHCVLTEYIHKESIQKARISAIDKANEIYNNTHIAINKNKKEYV